jgi:hypothetical protein
MSAIRVSRTARRSILSSLSALGASQPSVRTESIPRTRILASLAAAGASLAAVESAEAGIIVVNPNANVGFAAGNVTSFKFNLNSLKAGGLKLAASTFLTGKYHNLAFRGTTFADNPNVQFRIASVLVAPAAFGKKSSQVGTGHSIPFLNLATRSKSGSQSGANFSKEYYAFSFLDASNQTHYGWMYGSLSGGYGDLSYNLISYAYDTTPNQQITTGQTAVPEPSALVLGAMAALILGAAGVRKWKKDQQAKATVV